MFPFGGLSNSLVKDASILYMLLHLSLVGQIVQVRERFTQGRQTIEGLQLLPPMLRPAPGNLTETLQAVTAPLIRLPGWMVWPILKLYQIRTGIDFTRLRNIDDMAVLGDRPFYAIGDMRDKVTLPGDARRLYEASHSSLRQLWEVPDTGHTDSRFYYPKEFDQRLIGFFDEALKR